MILFLISVNLLNYYLLELSLSTFVIIFSELSTLMATVPWTSESMLWPWTLLRPRLLKISLNGLLKCKKMSHDHVTTVMFHSRYDVDKSGAIDKKEMTKVMTSIYVMLTTSDDNKAKQNAEEQATAHAAKLFKEVDVNNDGELSEEEFIDGCKKDKELMMKLQQLVDQCMGK